MSFGSSFFAWGGGGGVLRIAALTASSRSAEVTGPFDVNHTSSIDSARERIARATSPATRGAFSRALRESDSAALCSLAGCSAFTGSARARCRRSPASTRSRHIVSSVGTGPAALANPSSAVERTERARASSVSSACSASSASAAVAPHPPSAIPVEMAVRSASARSQHCASASGAIIGSAVASWSNITGRSITSAHHAAKGPSHRISSTSPSAVPRVVSTRRQNSELSAPCSGAGISRKPSARPSILRSQRHVSCAVGPRPGPRSVSSPHASSA